VIEAIEQRHLVSHRCWSARARSPLRSARLHAGSAGLSFRLLNARQDADEAAIVADAASQDASPSPPTWRGAAPTSSSPPASPSAAAARDLHRAPRLGPHRPAALRRCGRQGDPGSCEAILAADDDLAATHAKLPSAWLANMERVPSRTGRLLYCWRSAAPRPRTRVRGAPLLQMDESLATCSPSRGAASS